MTRGLPPPDPHSVLCPQLNLLNPSPKKIPGYAAAGTYFCTTAMYSCTVTASLLACVIAEQLGSKILDSNSVLFQKQATLFCDFPRYL